MSRKFHLDRNHQVQLIYYTVFFLISVKLNWINLTHYYAEIFFLLAQNKLSFIVLHTQNKKPWKKTSVLLNSLRGTKRRLSLECVSSCRSQTEAFLCSLLLLQSTLQAEKASPAPALNGAWRRRMQHLLLSAVPLYLLILSSFTKTRPSLLTSLLKPPPCWPPLILIIRHSVTLEWPQIDCNYTLKDDNYTHM